MEPIEINRLDNEDLRGRSRRWGDADISVQSRAADEIIQQGSNWPEGDLALALAIIKIESGFNPDAAVGSSSAAGIGQFIDKTGEAYGLTDENRFDLKIGVRAFLKHLAENLKRARDTVTGTSNIYARSYALHHDGPNLSFGGEKIARDRVLPELNAMRKFIQCRKDQLTLEKIAH